MRRFAWIGVALLVTGGVAAAAVLSGGEPEPSPSPSPSLSPSPSPTQPPVFSFVVPDDPSEVGAPLAEAGCGPVQQPELQKPTEVKPGDKHPPYSSTPPTSGAHYPDGPGGGVFFVPHDPEAVVASMARGDVVVWHTGFSKGMRNDLIGLLTYFESDFLMAQPGDEMKLDHEMVLTAWGHLQECEEFSGEAVEQFFLNYRGRGPGL